MSNPSIELTSPGKNAMGVIGTTQTTRKQWTCTRRMEGLEYLSSCCPLKYIILNLNGLLVKKWKGKTSNKVGYIKHGDYAIQLQNGATKFLDNLFNNFKVGIWSSMTMKGIQHYVEYFNIIRNQQYRFYIIWDRTKCYSAPKYRIPGNRRVRIFFKPLTYLWNTCCGPLLINALLIDDAPYKKVA
ncbi:hypothetical protein O6H91_07G108000 [Diphasiastrum complanatum]|uniref:Uncharacterized protein n=1 Tax=Diphasiastrum complanatum TaxID=34168 RepID=A0ACC2D8F7_DIPCM|nr:hypothetical protein O6H91_07G108000 [Diphasiastrum complanatum]